MVRINRFRTRFARGSDPPEGRETATVAATSASPARARGADRARALTAATYVRRRRRRARRARQRAAARGVLRRAVSDLRQAERRRRWPGAAAKGRVRGDGSPRASVSAELRPTACASMRRARARDPEAATSIALRWSLERAEAIEKLRRRAPADHAAAARSASASPAAGGRAEGERPRGDQRLPAAASRQWQRAAPHGARGRRARVKFVERARRHARVRRRCEQALDNVEARHTERRAAALAFRARSSTAARAPAGGRVRLHAEHERARTPRSRSADPRSAAAAPLRGARRSAHSSPSTRGFAARRRTEDRGVSFQAESPGTELDDARLRLALGSSTSFTRRSAACRGNRWRRPRQARTRARTGPRADARLHLLRRGASSIARGARRVAGPVPRGLPKALAAGAVAARRATRGWRHVSPAVLERPTLGGDPERREHRGRPAHGPPRGARHAQAPLGGGRGLLPRRGRRAGGGAQPARRVRRRCGDRLSILPPRPAERRLAAAPGPSRLAAVGIEGAAPSSRVPPRRGVLPGVRHHSSRRSAATATPPASARAMAPRRRSHEVVRGAAADGHADHPRQPRAARRTQSDACGRSAVGDDVGARESVESVGAVVVVVGRRRGRSASAFAGRGRAGLPAAAERRGRARRHRGAVPRPACSATRRPESTRSSGRSSRASTRSCTSPRTRSSTATTRSPSCSPTTTGSRWRGRVQLPSARARRFREEPVELLRAERVPDRGARPSEHSVSRARLEGGRTQRARLAVAHQRTQPRRRCSSSRGKPLPPASAARALERANDQVRIGHRETVV